MSGKRVELKILGASADKADANLYLDGEKIGEAVIRREPGEKFDLFNLLGEVLHAELEAL